MPQPQLQPVQVNEIVRGVAQIVTGTIPGAPGGRRSSAICLSMNSSR